MNIEAYIQYLAERKESHFGYPYNLGFSCSQYAGLLDYLINNLGDPYMASNYHLDSRTFEQAVVAYFARLWHFAEEYWGYVTSSGTEGNLAALLYGKSSLHHPIVYASADTHYSVSKACFAYGLELILVPSSETGEMNYASLEKMIRPERNAIAICNVSTTFRGAYDSVRKIRQAFDKAGVSRERVFVHGDAALGGMIVPFLDDVERDYRIDGLEFDALSVSGHKMIGTPIPCGVILTKKAHVDTMARQIEYLNSRDSTLSGSRNGLAAILLHQRLMQTSQQEWKERVQTCVDNAQYLCQTLREGGLHASLNRYSNTVVFPRPDEHTVQQWQLACLGNQAHAIVMPQHSRAHIDEFAFHLVKSFQLAV
jgi:histidine decarboxylase